VIALAACGSQAKTVEVKKQAPPSPRKVILASIRATTAEKSARMSMRMTMTMPGDKKLAVTADGVTDLTTGDGVMTMQFDGNGSGFLPGGIEIRVVDHTAYMKMPEQLGAAFGGGKWLKTPNLGDAGGALPAGQSDPSKFLAYLEAVSNGVKKVGTDSIRGVETTHYSAMLDLGKAVDRADVPSSLRDDLRKLFGQTPGADSAIPADVWVDGDGLARRIELQLSLGALLGSDGPAGADKVSVSVSMDLYDFGVPVHVEAPPAGETVPLPVGPSGTIGTPS
jgi:hypothetical protein